MENLRDILAAQALENALGRALDNLLAMPEEKVAELGSSLRDIRQTAQEGRRITALKVLKEKPKAVQITLGVSRLVAPIVQPIPRSSLLGTGQKKTEHL